MCEKIVNATQTTRDILKKRKNRTHLVNELAQGRFKN